MAKKRQYFNLGRGGGNRGFAIYLWTLRIGHLENLNLETWNLNDLFKEYTETCQIYI